MALQDAHRLLRQSGSLEMEAPFVSFHRGMRFFIAASKAAVISTFDGRSMPMSFEEPDP